MTEPKLCKDCRWAKDTTGGALRERRSYDYRCTHPHASMKLPPDYVLGEPVTSFQDLCTNMRDSERCGPEGRLWEPREE